MKRGVRILLSLTYFDNHVKWLFMLLTVIER